MLQGLYVFSNINIPLALLAYLTILKLRKKQQIGYGKWFLMIIVLYLTSIITSFFQIRGFILLIDFAIKIGVCLLPSSVNRFIETSISHLHLQILIEHVRCIIINHFAIWHWKLTQYALGKMDSSQRKQFKNMLIQRISNMQTADRIGSQKHIQVKNQNRLTEALKSSYKHFQNKGVNCDIPPIITPLDSKIKEYAFQTQKSIEKNKSRSPIQKVDIYQQSLKPTKQRREQNSSYGKYDKNDRYKVSIPLSQEPQEHTYSRQSPYNNYNNTYRNSPSQNTYTKNNQNHLLRSARNYGVSQYSNLPSNQKQQHQYASEIKFKKSVSNNILDQLKQQNPRNKFAQQIQEMTGSRQLRQKGNFSKKPSILSNQYQTSQSRYRKQIEKNQRQIQKKDSDREYNSYGISNSNSPNRQKQSKDNTAERILQNLDVSVSEYSQYFDQEQDFDDNYRKQVCVVEAIVEIGHRITAQLQIYNIQLYSNHEVRIVSLYGRQFQKAKLKYLTALPNHYYYLHYQSGSNQKEGAKRKVKFRGNAQPFMVFLKQDLIQ